MERTFITNNENETFLVGRQLGQLLSSGDFLALKGDLGAGKTAFTKGIVKGTGIKADVTSPTFTIINEYDGDPRLIHIDVYRLDDPRELEDVGFTDYLTENIVVMEWADKVAELLPNKVLWVNFDILGSQQRKIRLVSNCGYYDKILQELNGHEDHGD